MQITSAVLVAFLGATSVSATCNEGGLKWAEQSNALYHIGRACRGYDGKAGAFQGYFNPDQMKQACVNGVQDTYYIFQIRNQNQNAGFDLGDDDCDLRLGNLVRGCSRGGQDSIAGWFFQASTRRGQCP